MFNRFFALVLLVIATTFITNAQGYITAGGLRYHTSEDSNALGITLQQRIMPNVTIGLIAERRHKEPIITATARYHKPILFKGFNVFAGVGAHTNAKDLSTVTESLNNFKYGLNIIAGAELRLPFFPLVVTADFMPEINKVKNIDPVNAKEWNALLTTNFSVKYVFYSDKMKRKKLRKQRKEVRKEKRQTFFDNIKDKDFRKEKRKQFFGNIKNKFSKKPPVPGKT